MRNKLAFQTLKDLLCSHYVLAHLHTDLPYKLNTDASGYCVGGILAQDQDGQEKVTQYVNHQLSGS